MSFTHFFFEFTYFYINDKIYNEGENMKNNKYLKTTFLVLMIFSFVFIVKGIFPFGDKSIIWSDMHDQITAFYYHFYDAVRGGKSFFVDFTSGGGINFWGVMVNYITSPISLILLLFPRGMVENAVSLVVVLKTLLASLTCLYFISKYFKKIKPSYQILLSLLYAFSSYTFLLYIIPAWMDMVYLFPILLIGLRKLLDLEDVKLYIIVLSISIICSFYVSFIVLLFIIFASFLYLYIYKKDNMKHAIFNLGVSTVISLMISAFFLFPTFIQLSESQRAGFDLAGILNSKFGPLSDKISFLFASGCLISLVLLLLFNFKKHKKFTSFLLPLLIMVGLPLIIEPVNKIWHFGSYYYFPYRYGFILIFLLVIGASYYLNNVNQKDILSNKLKKWLPLVSVVISLLCMTFIIVKFDESIMMSIDKLTLSSNKISLLLLFFVFILVFVSSLVIFISDRKSKANAILLYILIISNILFNGYFYLGGYDPDEKLLLQYDQMIKMNKIKGVTGNYYMKEVDRDLISNYGMVTGINTFSNFTSLVNKNTFLTMQRFGYDSYGMDVQSIGGNLFSDILLAQKYIVSNDEINDSYYEFINNELGLNYYEFKNDMSYGYIIKNNVSLENSKNSFDASNMVYNSIADDGNIFDIYDLISYSDLTLYKKDLALEEKVEVVGKRRLYLDLFVDYDHNIKMDNYKAFDVYVNGNLVYHEVPNSSRNGTLLLGDFENESVDIKIVSLNDTMIRSITLGSLDLSKIDKFLLENKVDSKIDFSSNVINISVVGNKDDVLFIPITYLNGYTSNHEILRVYDNFVGIRLNDGINNIEIAYMPKGIIIGAIISVLGILLYFIWVKFLININLSILHKPVFYIYMVLYFVLVIVFYLVLPLMFVKSFVF